MAQLLLIKEVNTPDKHVGDGVGVYEDTHIFSEREHEAFTILQIKGSREEIWEKIVSAYPQKRDVYCLLGKWTFIRPKDKKLIEQNELAWQGKDGDWRFIKNEPKFKWSYRNLNSSEKNIIKIGDMSIEKENVLKKTAIDYTEYDMINDVKIPDVNDVKIPDVNEVEVG